ncbi:MAG: glycosyltransferase family 4 protein [Chloroflexi bacterium]|nr:glycosyltransferase family 4 protein [Chloroflexota bacterium]MBP8055669.1 glycosyltransferase family 4 protein [Chloroflexota bacterium]
MKDKIAFIRKGTVPLASAHVAQALQESFPHLTVEVIDIKQWLTGRPEIVVWNTLYTLKEYGGEIVRGRKKARDCFFRTTYLFQTIKTLMGQKLASPDYLFSFQMQSLFDASVPGLPHFIYTDHTNLANNLYTIQDRTKLYSPAWIDLERTIYQNACHIFTRSTNIIRSLIEQYRCDPQKVSCAYAGSNIPFHNHTLENDSYQNKNILFVGIDWQRKGGPELLAAFRQVLTVHPDAHLTIVGCSPQVNTPNCEVIGRVPLNEISYYYRRASIFCLPTKLEPFGIVFIEALSYQLPVVGTCIGAIPDFISQGENGYMVQPGQVSELAQALINLLDDPEKCRRFGERGRVIAQDKYTWHKVGSRMKEGILAKGVT